MERKISTQKRVQEQIFLPVTTASRYIVKNLKVKDASCKYGSQVSDAIQRGPIANNKETQLN